MFEQLLGEALGVGDPRVLARAKLLAESELLCLGRRTISGLLTTCGQQDRDWSAPYRLFERGRVDNARLFAASRRAVCGLLPGEVPLVAMLDDTLIKKRGRKVAGTSWRRDPLGPRFCNNIIWSQRFLQVSAALPESAEGPSRARGVPISLSPAPSPRKPRRAAPPAEWVNYRAELKASALSRRGAEQIAQLRSQLDDDPENAGRQLMVTVDGGYTNGTVLRRLPERVTVIGRIRKDAKLYAPPGSQPGRGRKRLYGEQMPTPEQLRQDESVPGEEVAAYGAGKVHSFQVKSFAPCRWKAAGGRDVRVIVIRPLAYRPTRNSRVLYRQPGYLICTDPRLPLEQNYSILCLEVGDRVELPRGENLAGRGRGPGAKSPGGGCGAGVQGRRLFAPARGQRPLQRHGQPASAAKMAEALHARATHDHPTDDWSDEG